MSDIKKTSHIIGKIKQLIDLNGDNTNFDLSFTVTCQDDTPFYLLVVDQTTLDNTPELEYKEVNGSISGNIVADKNIYQNYFLILKSDKQCNVDIEITLKILPKTPELKETQDPPQDILKRKTIVDDKKPCINWKKTLLILLVIVVGIYVLWWLYNRNVIKDAVVTHSFDNIKPDTLTKLPFQSPFRSPFRSPARSPDISPVQSPTLSTTSDARVYKPVYKKTYKTSISPDVMSQMSNNNSEDGGNSLLNRLRKFAR
jgi:hypothetical protein